MRVHTPQKGLEHALLYSIGVNLPAHRVGQIDRVLVLASPINDINIHAWDLNRVKHFMRLDIGIQMELCGMCVTSSLQGTSITFIIDKVFHDDCINFLCHEARISDQPVFENNMLVYPVSHICSHSAEAAHPPSYLESQRHTAASGRVIENGSAPPELPPRNIYTTHHDIVSQNAPANGSSHATFKPAFPAKNPAKLESVPPRNITRRNHESAVPAMAHPYMNFLPQVFQHNGSTSYDSPYQISSRIIITDSGEVQYERNVLGNKHQHHGGFHFKSTLPLPPRSGDAARPPPPTFEAKARPTFEVSRSPNRTTSLPTSHSRREEQKQKRKLEKCASEFSDDCDDAYVFIPDIVYDPTRVPLPQTLGEPTSGTLPTESSSEGPEICGPPPEGSTRTLHNSYEKHPLPDSYRSGEMHFQDHSFDSSCISETEYEGGDEGAASFSGDYEDNVMLVSQQLSITQASTGLSHVVATQEIRPSDSLVPVPPGNDYVFPPSLQLSCQTRSKSPNKPRVKPRTKKPAMQSNSLLLPSNHHSPMKSSVQKSATIPHVRTLSSELSLSSHHTLDLTLGDEEPSSPFPSLVLSSENFTSTHSHPHPVSRSQLTQLTHSPLTPPVPRPRPLFTRVGGSRQSEDDSVLDRCHATSSDSSKSRLSTTFSTSFFPSSDL